MQNSLAASQFLSHVIRKKTGLGIVIRNFASRIIPLAIFSWGIARISWTCTGKAFVARGKSERNKCEGENKCFHLFEFRTSKVYNK